MAEKNIKHKLADYLDIPKEIILDYPLVSLIGNEEVAIQNHKGLIEYTDNVLRLKTALYPIRVDGKNFVIQKITNEYVKISGIIVNIAYEV